MQTKIELIPPGHIQGGIHSDDHDRRHQIS